MLLHGPSKAATGAEPNDLDPANPQIGCPSHDAPTFMKCLPPKIRKRVGRCASASAAVSGGCKWEALRCDQTYKPSGYERVRCGGQLAALPIDRQFGSTNAR